jgi:hypothetical protein
MRGREAHERCGKAISEKQMARRFRTGRLQPGTRDQTTDLPQRPCDDVCLICLETPVNGE